MDPKRTRWWAALLIALLAFVSVGSFVHTDDGCQVEIHCLACRLALGSRAGNAVAEARIAPRLSHSDPSPPYQLPFRLAPAARPRPSRGPPLT